MKNSLPVTVIQSFYGLVVTEIEYPESKFGVHAYHTLNLIRTSEPEVLFRC